MKRNLPVTQMERDYDASERLISETDLRGIVTTANASFCEVAGFSQEELVGKSHNIVRHPDMPQEAFADLWRTLKAGERWVGLVKNRCKNGDHYWVKAFVSPVVQDGRIIGYRSVRKKPTRTEIAEAEALYQRLHAGEKGLIDTLADRKRRMNLGDRLSVGKQLALVGGWPWLVAAAVGAGVLLHLPWTAVIAVASVGAVVSLVLMRLASRWLTAPLDELDRAISAFEHGDLATRAELHGSSRFATMALGLNRALDGVEVALADMGQMLGSLANGEFGRRIVATLPGELDRIKGSANRAAEQIESTVEALNSQLAALADGRLDVRREATSSAAQGKFREARENAAMAASRLATVLEEMIRSNRAMSEGDLTQPLRAEALGELATLRSNFNHALSSLSDTLLTVRSNAQHVSQASSDISRTIEELAQAAATQMGTVEQVTAAVEESGGSITQIAASADAANTKSLETLATVASGRERMAQLVERVTAIAENSERISTITEVIEGIAGKTNLLSLNAAIEAARAGENGRGFAVVATEVGSLAVSAAKSAKEIADLVRQAVTETRRATESVSEVSADMDRIERAARESGELLSRTAAALDEQSRTLTDIGDHTRELGTIAQSNAAATEELAATASELARLAEATHQAASRFKT